MESERLKLFLLVLFDTLLLLFIFFLGFMSGKWTTEQIRNYCYYQFPMSANLVYDYWGKPIVNNNITINITGD